MTNKQTIDGVSRELLERALRELMDWEAADEFASVKRTHDELRALLDKPAAKNWEYFHNAMESERDYWKALAQKPAAQPQGEIVSAKVSAYTPGMGLVEVRLSGGIPSWLELGESVTITPGLPQPQGEVERLQKELARKTHCYQFERANGTELRAQLTERDALLNACVIEFGTSEASGWEIMMREKINAALSTSAEPKPRGEPAEWAYCPECGCEEIHHQQGRHKQCAECHQEWFSDIDYSDVVRGHLKKLKAEHPAPVASGTTSSKYKAELYDEVWQKARDMGFANVTDALNEVAKLNGLKP